VLATLNGATQQQIAESRGVSPRTIANQLAVAYRKVGVASRMELAAKLSRVG
jgi:DNA-binding CsgD family transcriptional regulator